MAILENEVWVTLAGTNVKHYENLGYHIPRVKNKWHKIQVKSGTKIKIKVEDLQNGSMASVTKVCDVCERHIENQSYKDIIKHRKGTDGKDRCNDCGAKYNARMRKLIIPYEKSLEFYSINNKKYLLGEFSKRNHKTPKEINYSTEDMYWWNCPDCKSEYDMKVVNRTYNGSKCPFCSGSRVNNTNSLLACFPEIAEEWNYTKNGELNPQDFTFGSKVVVWWKCELNHEWEATINRRTNMKSGCPVCNESKGERKIRNLLESNKLFFIPQKEFANLVGLSGGNLSYDFYLPEQNLLIEFQGQFHDGKGNDYVKENLEKQQEHDKRKREYANHNNIGLLEIWYWDYDNIEEKLKNILNKEELND